MVIETTRICREKIAAEYETLLSGDGEISSDAALQLLADIRFLEIALSGHENAEFSSVRVSLFDKV
jgi:hypothetical protein